MILFRRWISVINNLINEKLKKWAKTDKGRKAIGKSLKSSGNGGGSPTDTTIQKYAQRMKDILQEEITSIRSSNTNEDFLNYINIDKSVSIVKVQDKEFLSISLSFDKNKVTRESLRPQIYKHVYLPTLINNDWNITTPNQAYGYDRHGNFIVGTKEWIYKKDKGFMQRAVNRFNVEMSSKGIKAEYNTNYDRGTYGTKEY